MHWKLTSKKTRIHGLDQRTSVISCMLHIVGHRSKAHLEFCPKVYSNQPNHWMYHLEIFAVLTANYKKYVFYKAKTSWHLFASLNTQGILRNRMIVGGFICTSPSGLSVTSSSSQCFPTRMASQMTECHFTSKEIGPKR